MSSVSSTMQFFPSVYTRVVHGSVGPAGRVGSGHDFARFWRIGSALWIFLVFLLIISWYLNRSKLGAKRAGSSHIFIVSANPVNMEIFLFFIERKRLY